MLNVSHTQPIEILTRLETNAKIADILLFDVHNSPQLYVLERSSKVAPVGTKLSLYELSRNYELRKTPLAFHLKSFFKHLHYAFGEPNTFVGTPYLTKQLRFFKITDGTDVTFFDVKPTGHNVREVKIFTCKKWLITAGHDGLAVIKSNNLRNSYSVNLKTHHQRDFGAAKAILNDAGDLLIALGIDGSLVAVRRWNLENLQQVDDDLKNLWEFGRTDFEDHKGKIADNSNTMDETLKKFLSDPTLAFLSYEGSDNSTWLQWREQQRIEEERKSASDEKEKILSKFLSLKNKVVELLDKNENLSQPDRLPVSAFDLNKGLRERQTKAAKDDREDVRHQVESDCLERERVADWIQSNFWEPQKVLAQSIFGIFDDTEVTNYTICADKIGLPNFFDFAQFARNVAKDITAHDTIYPWKSYTPSELNLMFDKQLRVNKSEKIGNLIGTIEEEPDVDDEEQKNRQLLEGKT